MWIGLASNVVAALISHTIIQNWSVGVHKIIEFFKNIKKKIPFKVRFRIAFIIKCELYPKKYLSKDGMKSRWKFWELCPF